MNLVSEQSAMLSASAASVRLVRQEAAVGVRSLMDTPTQSITAFSLHAAVQGEGLKYREGELPPGQLDFFHNYNYIKVI